VRRLWGFGWVLLLAAALLLSLCVRSPAAEASRSALVISEFMVDNASTLADRYGNYPDWIEIHNRTAREVDLAGWYLTDDERDLTRWQFPPVVLPGHGYLLVFASGRDRALPGAELHTNFELTAGGEYLALVEPDGNTVASEYAPEHRSEFRGISYPWWARVIRRRDIAPVYPVQFQDVSYGLDAGSSPRHFTVPTPGSANGAGPAALGPIIANVRHGPTLPTAQDDIVVTANLKASTAPVGSASLHYRVMYGDTTVIPMHDDGAHEDGAAEDGLYAAVIPGGSYRPGDMVRYYITAVDHEGNASRWPLFHDPAGSPEYLGTMISDPGVSSALPALYWFLADPAGAETDEGTRATLFYDCALYDNVLVHLRGGGKSRARPKKSFKFEFNAGHYFQYLPDQAPVEELNLNNTYTDKSYIRQILAWETYRDAGAPYSISFAVRVQQNGAFYSVAVFVEQPDSRYLERHGLDPDGALYKMHNPGTSSTVNVFKRTRLDEDNGDLQALLDGIDPSSPRRESYLFDHVNIPAVINYLAATTLIHDNDHVRLNHYLYRDTAGTGEWMFLPWDKDLTFGRNNLKGDVGTLNDVIWADDDPFSHPLLGDSEHAKRGGVSHTLIDAVYDHPVAREMYLRRLRTLMDALLQPPATAPEERHYEARIDELLAQMEPDVTLDAARWSVDWGTPQMFREAVDILKADYLAVRRLHLYQTHGRQSGGMIPDEQAADAAVEFGTVESNPASGKQDEEYFTLVNPTDAAVDISGWRITGDVEYTFQPGVVIPAGGAVYVSPDVVAFRSRDTSPTGGEGHFVQGGYAHHLSIGCGLLNLLDAGGELVASVVFCDAELLSEPVIVRLF